jgi:hypothetical protein
MSVRAKVPRERLRRRLLVRFGTGEPESIGFTANFSTSGLYVTTSSVLAPNSKLQIEIEGPHQIFQMQGRVVWAKKSPVRFSQSTPSGMGVELTDPGPEWLAFCKRFG